MFTTILLILSILLALSLGFGLGYAWRDVHDQLKLALKALATLAEKKKAELPRESVTIIDPNDLVARAKFERDERMRRINEE